jgi:hypothetical protein
MRLLIFIFGLVIVTAPLCFADIYEYTDENGVVHFTDDPSKIPVKIRRKIKAKESSLTTEESKIVNTLIKLDKNKTQDVPVNDLPAFKKNVKQFGEAFKDELGDPAEPKDSRLSNPEGAWNLFSEGLRNGNLSYIKSSLTGKQWNNSGYQELNKSQMAEFGKEVSKITITKKMQNENMAVFDSKNNKTGVNGTIKFINFYGNWKIYQF